MQIKPLKSYEFYANDLAEKRKAVVEQYNKEGRAFWFQTLLAKKNKWSFIKLPSYTMKGI